MMDGGDTANDFRLLDWRQPSCSSTANVGRHPILLLLFCFRKLVEFLDDDICFGRIFVGIIPTMLFNSLHQIGRSTVVQEKNAFPETPERRRTEFVSFCLALTYAVLECTIW